MRSLCNLDLVHPRGRDPPDVRRTDGLRSPELRAQENTQGRAAKADAWEGLRYAILPCTIRVLLLCQLDVVFAVQTRSQEALALAHAAEPGIENRTFWAVIGVCGAGGME